MRDDDLTERVAAAIRAELARRNLRRADLAAYLGVSEMSISRKLRGLVPMRTDELGPVAAFLGVTVETLITSDANGGAA